MNIEFKTGRPEKDGYYVVVTVSHDVAKWHFTVSYGWNTYGHYYESAIPDEQVVLWAEDFAQEAIDIYRQADIMEESKNED